MDIPAALLENSAFANDPLFWRLLYPSGLAIAEPPVNSCIFLEPPGASLLQVVVPDGRVVFEVRLAQGELPVWYRQRAQTAFGKELAATVFGACRARDGKAIDLRLYAGVEGLVIHCPPELVEETWLGMRVSAARK